MSDPRIASTLIDLAERRHRRDSKQGWEKEAGLPDLPSPEEVARRVREMTGAPAAVIPILRPRVPRKRSPRPAPPRPTEDDLRQREWSRQVEGVTLEQARVILAKAWQDRQR